MAIGSRKNIITALGNKIITSVGTEVDNRIYFSQESHQDKELPQILYFTIADVPEYHMSDESLDIDFQISIYDKKKIGALNIIEIADTLLNDLSRDTLTLTDYTNVDIQILEAGRIQVEGEYLHIIIEIKILGF